MNEVKIKPFGFVCRIFEISTRNVLGILTNSSSEVSGKMNTVSGFIKVYFIFQERNAFH